VREGDEYFQEWLNTEMQWNPSETYRLKLDHELCIRDYQDQLLDNFADSSLWLESRWKAARGMTLRIGNRLDYETEYQAETDEAIGPSPRVR